MTQILRLPPKHFQFLFQSFRVLNLDEWNTHTPSTLEILKAFDFDFQTRLVARRAKNSEMMMIIWSGWMFKCWCRDLIYKRLLRPGIGHWRLSQCPQITRDGKSWAQTESRESRKKERTEVCCVPVAPAGQYYQRLYRVSPPGPAGVGAPFFLGHRLASVTLPGSLVTSLEPRGQHSVLCQPQPGLAPAASPQNSSCLRRVPAPSSSHRRVVVRVLLQSDLDTPRLHHGDRELDTD